MKKKTILEAVIDDQSRIEGKDSSTWDGKVTDRTIKVCPVCDTCYDTKYYKDHADLDLVTYYQDFPTYGKERVACPKCL